MIIKRFAFPLFFYLVVLSTGVICQQLAPSLKDLLPSERFSSVDAGFSIALPKTGSVYSAMGSGEIGVNTKGGQYVWHLREGLVIVDYIESIDPNVVSVSGSFKDFVGGVKKGFFDEVKGAVGSEEYGQSDGMQTYRMDFELQSGKRGMCRVYSNGKQSFTLFAIGEKDLADSHALFIKALDSFARIPQDKAARN